MVSPILFPKSTAPGKDQIEGAGRLVNCYAETLQDGSPAGHVVRRAPGLTAFSETEESTFRGMWYDGENYLYAAFTDTLIRIDSTGAETTVGELLGARISFLTSEVDTSNTTAYTYSSIALGTAHAERRIIVGILYDDTDDAPAASVTIGGVSATAIVSKTNATDDLGVALYIANVPSGTTGDIVVTYATAAARSAIVVWRLDGTTSDTAYDTVSAESNPGISDTTAGDLINVPANGSVAAIAAAVIDASIEIDWTLSSSPIAEDSEDTVESAKRLSGASGTFPIAETAVPIAYYPSVTNFVIMAAASWAAASGYGGIVTFAKNNATTPNQVLCTPSLGAFSFTTSTITAISVNSELPNSVCFGEGYFFFTVPTGLVYASNLNSTTVTGTDVVRMEARAEQLVRGIFYDGALYVFGKTHTEVWASNGNPNASGFPFNRTTVFWKGLVAPLAVCGFEEGFEGGLYWVADDNSVRMLEGYQPVAISTPDLERAIAAVSDKSQIRMFVYDEDGHACVVVDLAQTATWVFDLGERTWHERKSYGYDYWRLTGNSVKAFGKWLVGDHLSGNIYQVDPSAYDEDGTTITYEVESIAMEAFPARLQVPRADFNFVGGVGDATTDDPEVFVSWSDDGGHTWSDPVTRKLGENGRYLEHVRINRVGMTGRKGRRWRLKVDDPVYVGLLGGSMEVEARS